MNNQVLRDKYRNQLTNVHAMTVFTVSLFEVIGYIILVLAGIEFFSIRNRYLWYGVVLPIAINTVTHLIARRIVNIATIDQEKKNTTIIIAALITSFVVAVIHKEYIVTSCAFIFPIILSSMFNSKKLLNASFITSIFILFSVGVAFWLDKSITLYAAICLFILFGFSFVSYLCGIISINFSKQNYITIESQAAQNDKLRNDLLFDQLTGLYNHRSFKNQLDERIQAYKTEAPLCLAMIDIDDFKKINDTYGHYNGDIVLAYMGKTLEKHSTQNVTAYRYGGEEFAVLFSKKNTDEASSVLQSVLNEFRKHKFKFFKDSVTITFSCGVVEYTESLTGEDFFQMADNTLYKAKKAGKNQILTSK